MPANRTETGKFTAGVSGNPLGRPKIPADVKEAIRAACPEAVEYLVALMRNPKEKTAYRLDAAKTLLDRGYGKPESMSKIELSGSNDGAIVFQWMNEQKSENTEAHSETFQT